MSRDGFVGWSIPPPLSRSRGAPLSRSDVLDGIQYMVQGRQSHESWAAYYKLATPKQIVLDPREYTGELEHQLRWIEFYDLFLDIAAFALQRIEEAS